MQEPPLLFISYDSRDAAAAMELRSLLTEDGYRIWMAPDEIRGSRPWAEQILEAVSVMTMMVVLVSSKAVESAHVAREVNLAFDRGKPVLPVRIEDVALSGSLQYLLALVQWVDAFPTPLSDHRERLLKEIADILQEGSSDVGMGPRPPRDIRPPRSFPPVPGLAEATTNLPVQVTTFVGREQEQAEVTKLVRGSRLVTLTGVGGSGKTRLGMHTAAGVAGDFPDGVWIVDLAPVSEPELVVERVAAVLNASKISKRPLIESLVEHVRSRQMIVILDNCEHLIDATCALARALLAGTAHLRIIATSREALHLPGELAYIVPPLGVPPAGKQLDLKVVESFDAVRLFVSRAEAVRPGFRLTAQSADAVLEICRRLDGVPLAIELAAARLGSFSPEQIAAHLDQRFRLLSGGRRTGIPRQETLQAAIDWSYALLNDFERLLFVRLGIFRGDFSLEAAKAIVAFEGLDEFALLDVLPRLIDKSLIVAEPTHGEMRYRMLETIRQYAVERLGPPEAKEALEVRHAGHFLALAEDGAANLRGAKHEEVLDRLRAEHDNMRQALRWSLDSDEIAFGLRLGGALYRFWLYNANNSEGAWWLETLLARGQQPVPDSVRARALVGFGSLSGDLLGRARSGTSALREAVDLYRSLAGEPSHRIDYATALNNLGADLGHQGDYVGAEICYEEALEIARQLGVHWGVALVLGNLGRVAAMRGRTDDARAHFNESVVEARRLGSPRLLADALGGRATFERDYGAVDQALNDYEESSRVFADADNALGAQLIRVALAVALVRLGDHERALDLFGPNAEAILDQPENLRQAEVLIDLALSRAEIDLGVGVVDRAAKVLGFAEGLIADAGYHDFLVRQRYLRAAIGEKIDPNRLEEAVALGRTFSVDKARKLIVGTSDSTHESD